MASTICFAPSKRTLHISKKGVCIVGVSFLVRAARVRCKDRRHTECCHPTVRLVSVHVPDQDPSASKFYLNGYGRFSDEARSFATIAAVSSRLTEAFQTELMEDSRVAIKYPDLWQVVSEELRWIIDLPWHIWECLALVARRHPLEVRDSTIQAAHTSLHFLWRRVLEPAGDLPWSLCRGDLVQNLRDLKAEPEEPEEPVCSQLYQLLHDDCYPDEKLVQVLQLLGQVGWTSLPCEQQHGSLAQLKKWHPEYTEATLIARGLMHHTSRILPQATAEQKRLSAINRQIAKLCKAKPERVGGQHMLLKAMISIAKGRKDISVN